MFYSGVLMRRVNEQAAGGEWNAGCFRLVPYGSTSRVALYAAHDDDVCFKRLVDTTLCGGTSRYLQLLYSAL